MTNTKRLFVCLANSRKYSGRCIAGIELQKSITGYRVRYHNDRPTWIRPVSGEQHGAVNAHLVDHVRLLDIVEITNTNPIPDGYQSENCLFQEEKLQVIGKVPHRKNVLDKLLTENIVLLFGNRGKAVHMDKVNDLDHSLVFIKPQNFEVHTTVNLQGKRKMRGQYIYNGNSYDLPITDIDFTRAYQEDNNILREIDNLYITISLGVEYEAWHYKLIAGIIYF